MTTRGVVECKDTHRSTPPPTYLIDTVKYVGKIGSTAYSNKLELGRIEDVRFIVTTMMPSGASGENELGYVADLKGAGKDGVDVYQAVIFGEDYYALAESLAPEIRTDDTEDFGREVKIAWYGIWGTDVLNPTHGVVVETV